MNQNSIIAFALIIGFVVFITMRGELQKYLAVIGLAPGSGSTAPLGSLPSLFQGFGGATGGSIGTTGTF